MPQPDGVEVEIKTDAEADELWSYTLHRINPSFPESLKLQCEQRLKFISVRRMRLPQAVPYRCFKLIEAGIVFRPQAFLFHKLP